MTIDDLLPIIGEGLKKKISKENILTSQIEIGYLKRIDKFFNKGIHYYLDPKSPEISHDASIFFRKQKFDIDLNIGAKKIVNQFEEFKISLSAIAKLADIRIDRSLPIYKILDSPSQIAQEIRTLLNPTFISDKKDFLKSIISKLAEQNILVFEFVETWNKKDKANIDGFFLNPNVIVLKRQQTSFRREIFTLIHELGHYLLNEEEIEQIDYQSLARANLNKIEKWCNDFAYYFLIGDSIQEMESINIANSSNDYQFELIRKISNDTHLSQIALFTRLLFQKKMSQTDYNVVKADLEEQYRKHDHELKKQRELDKENGLPVGGSTPKPINSPLLISTIQTAFYEGVINEYEVCKRLNIKPDKLETVLQ
ncbi:ImmA/IrrE family metallo-endopeptidase [Dyadobacter sp. CY347]|uniref:ImmA/IrrE family metallo-endopeptidase n=1 Tax=Dyadobacter sp. CY347 TaxID=2909336 RepID=UPI001F3C96AF|nr:ImmA/IrrE family metallo-endopeptidase [Dyadobacter sp. CY347]MCF2489956.1 ImmA/IrrE family metallo-endopeptidase [Dyadobacter sp. CY347]